MDDTKGKKASHLGAATGVQAETTRPAFDPARLARDYETDPPSRRPTPHAGTEYDALRDSCKPMQAARAISQFLPQVHPDNVVVVALPSAQLESLGLKGTTGALVAAMDGVRTVRAVAVAIQVDLPTALLRTAFLVERGIVRVVG